MLVGYDYIDCRVFPMKTPNIQTIDMKKTKGMTKEPMTNNTKEEREITDETKMPDGRPLWAWRNEVEMGRSKRKHFEEMKREVGLKWVLLNIVEIQQQREYHTGDYLFRVSRADQMVARNEVEALEAAQITRL